MAVEYIHFPWLTAASIVVSVLSVIKVIDFVLSEKKPEEVLGLFRKAVLKRIKAWAYLLNGPGLIEEAYDQAKGENYEIYTPDLRMVFVSSSKYISEVNTAPDTVLSLQAASKHMLQPVYTMHGFNWFDRRGTEGVGFVRALRTHLTNNLPQILPDLRVVNMARMTELLEGHQVVDGVRHSPVFPMIVQLVVLSNAFSFFGKDLAKNEEFLKYALKYIEETIVCAEAVRLVPKFLVPIVGGAIARRLKSHQVIFDTLMPIAEQRCQERELAKIGQPVPKHADCIQWIMETSPRAKPWGAQRVVYELMAIWFGSVHALSTTITFAIHDLCLHPEYIEPLRKELEAGYETFEATGAGLPLLDSFIKESARLTPIESISTRRGAIQPFTLSDGTKLAVGDWVVTPLRSIMRDAQHYPEPLAFNGFRFADPKVVESLESGFDVTQPNPSKLTDASDTFHVWGSGRMVCPGRFYAAAVMKLIIGQIILNYNCKLVEPEKSRFRSWRSSTLPKAETMVVFAPR